MLLFLVPRPSVVQAGELTLPKLPPRKKLTAANLIFTEAAVRHTITAQEGQDAALGRTQELRLLAGAWRGGGGHLHGTVHLITAIRAVLKAVTPRTEGQTLPRVRARELGRAAGWTVGTWWSYRRKRGVQWFYPLSSHSYECLWDWQRKCWERSWLWILNSLKKEHNF